MRHESVLFEKIIRYWYIQNLISYSHVKNNNKFARACSIYVLSCLIYLIFNNELHSIIRKPIGLIYVGKKFSFRE